MLFRKKKNHIKLYRLMEFFIVGVVMGVSEDLIAILIATEEPLSFRIFWVATMVALPFAVISELIVDLPEFRKSGQNWLKRLLRR